MGEIAYVYDPEPNLVRARAEDIIGTSDILNYVRRVLDDAAIRPGFIEVVDFEPVKDLVVSYSELAPFQQVWRRYREKGCRATIIFAPSAVAYGICRMFQAVIDPAGDEAENTFLITRTSEEMGAKLAELGAADSWRSTRGFDRP